MLAALPRGTEFKILALRCRVLDSDLGFFVPNCALSMITLLLPPVTLEAQRQTARTATASSFCSSSMLASQMHGADSVTAEERLRQRAENNFKGATAPRQVTSPQSEVLGAPRRASAAPVGHLPWRVSTGDSESRGGSAPTAALSQPCCVPHPRDFSPRSCFP